MLAGTDKVLLKSLIILKCFSIITECFISGFKKEIKKGSNLVWP